MMAGRSPKSRRTRGERKGREEAGDGEFMSAIAECMESGRGEGNFIWR
jgi:hypothetical protein